MPSSSSVSIGNDLVDLRAQEPLLHPRFLARVFTSHERSQIGDSRPALWLHWAAKEAAYKALRRENPTLKFHPREFEFDRSSNVVRVGSRALYCQCVGESDFVYVSCATDRRALSSTGVRDWIAEVPDASSPLAHACMPASSWAVRCLARRTISRALGRPEGHITIGTWDGEKGCGGAEYRGPHAVPLVFIQGKASPYPISFTHHGRFAACSFYLPDARSEVHEAQVRLRELSVKGPYIELSGLAGED